jgi:hypothetical protein
MLASTCSGYYALISPQIVYTIYSLNAFYAFIGGIVVFNLIHTMYNTCRRKEVVDCKTVFNDWLVVRHREATWFGYLFCMLYVNIIALVFE